MRWVHDETGGSAGGGEGESGWTAGRRTGGRTGGQTDERTRVRAVGRSSWWVDGRADGRADERRAGGRADERRAGERASVHSRQQILLQTSVIRLRVERAERAGRVGIMCEMGADKRARRASCYTKSLKGKETTLEVIKPGGSRTSCGRWRERWCRAGGRADVRAVGRVPG